MKGAGTADEHRAALALAERALRAIPAALPELAELVTLVRVSVDPRVQTAGIFESGRLVLHPTWFLELSLPDAMFVLAHELLHLLLRTHGRTGRMDHRATNIAHDYIINDLLREMLGRDIPAGGLDLEGARHLSLEALTPRVAELMDTGYVLQSFRGGTTPLRGTLGSALRKAGLRGAGPIGGVESLDVLGESTERDWYPGETPTEIDRTRTAVRAASLRAIGLSELKQLLKKAYGEPGSEAGGLEMMFESLRAAYTPPWFEALQTWMEAVAPGDRTFARPSRRGADRTDVVLPGRRREGWTLHVILDTSGSMVSEIQRILGAIASFCESANVAVVRVLQCDTEVTKDELVPAENLARFAIGGMGGSDMSPAMWRLAQDPEVESAIVITDGYIEYPQTPMPYEVLWAVTQRYFRPPYGRVVALPPV